jgi:hypothetical protein
MDKILLIAFPAITFAILTVGVVLFEAGKYLQGVLF